MNDPIISRFCAPDPTPETEADIIRADIEAEREAYEDELEQSDDGTILRFPESELAWMRDVLANSPSIPQPFGKDGAALLCSCSDHALKQIAEAGIRLLSWNALAVCWSRGIRCFTRK